MAAWPVSLPALVLRQGFEEREPDNTVRTEMEAGLDKVRARYTSGDDDFQQTLGMTSAQIDTFKTFYRTTLSYGTLSFTWVHPRTQAAKTFRFLKPPPRYVNEGGDAWLARFALEIVP